MKKEFTKKITGALEELRAADKDLAALLREIHVTPRSAKVTVTKSVEHALARLALARNNLVELQKLVAREDD